MCGTKEKYYQKRRCSMAKYKVTIESEITIDFDENSEEFTNIFKGYKSHFDSNATHESLCEDVASMIARYGTKEFIEGLGYVKLKGETQHGWINGKYQELVGFFDVDADTDLNSMINFECRAELIEDKEVQHG